MNPGDIILIDFPFTDKKYSKVRPAVVITETIDKYKDIIICAISSGVPDKPNNREIVIRQNSSDFVMTGLRTDSVIKVEYIATLRQVDVIACIGKCTPLLWQNLSKTFCRLVEQKTSKHNPSS